LISEGYVIEFNDGSLDLPRGKIAPNTQVHEPMDDAPVNPSQDDRRLTSADQ
jgi:hypothetical protein